MQISAKKILSCVLATSLAFSTITTHAKIFGFFKKNIFKTKKKKTFFAKHGNKLFISGIAVIYASLGIALYKTGFFRAIFHGLFDGYLYPPKPYFPPYPQPKPRPQPDEQNYTDIFDALATWHLPNIQKAVETNNVDITKLNDTGQSPLDLALTQNCWQIAEYLITKNAPLFGNVTTHLYNHLIRARKREISMPIIKHLIQNGADINHKHVISEQYRQRHERRPGWPCEYEYQDKTALEIVLCRKIKNVVEYLITKKPTLSDNTTEKFFNYLLHEENISLSFVRYLVEHVVHTKKDQELIDDIVFCTIQRGKLKVIKYLIKNLIENKINIFIACWTVQTRLRNECRLPNGTGSLEIVKLMLRFCGRPTRYKQIASKSGNHQIANYLQSVCKNSLQMSDLIKKYDKTQDLNVIAQLLEVVENSGKQIDSKTIQHVIETLIKIYKKSPKLPNLDKEKIKKLFKLISFNASLFMLYHKDGHDSFQELKKFAMQENVTDCFGTKIIDAARHLCHNKKMLEDLVSIEFSKKEKYHNMTEEQLVERLEKQNCEFDKILNQMICVHSLMEQGEWKIKGTTHTFPNLSSHIASYLNSESLNDIAKKISKVNHSKKKRNKRKI